MEASNLSANMRYNVGRGHSHQLRENHKVPGVLYGRNAQNIFVEFSEMELSDIIKKHGEHAIVNININGDIVKTMIKEVQREPVNRKLVHIDMNYIKDNEVVHADIPIMIRGEDMIRSIGGIVQKQLSTISIESMPDKLPKYIIADVSKLNIGDKLTISDVEFSSDIITELDMNSIIATIISAKEKEGKPEEEQIAIEVTSTQKVEVE